MHQAAFHLASRWGLHEAKQKFLKVEGIKEEEERNLLARSTLLRESCPPKGSKKSLSGKFLVLTGKFHVDWLKAPLLGG